MIIRKLLINFIFVVLGCLLGFDAAQYLRREFQASPLMCIIAMFFFLTVSIVIAQIIILRTTRFGDGTAILPHAETWGWLVPRNEAAKAGYPLHKDRTTIGRDVKNDILINHDSVSREHAEVLKTQDGFLINDVGSRNGLFVNSQRVKDHMLQQGDLVAIGDLEFFFRSSQNDGKDAASQEAN